MPLGSQATTAKRVRNLVVNKEERRFLLLVIHFEPMIRPSTRGNPADLQASNFDLQCNPRTMLLHVLVRICHAYAQRTATSAQRGNENVRTKFRPVDRRGRNTIVVQRDVLQLIQSFINIPELDGERF